MLLLLLLLHEKLLLWRLPVSALRALASSRQPWLWTTRLCLAACRQQEERWPNAWLLSLLRPRHGCSSSAQLWPRQQWRSDDKERPDEGRVRRVSKQQQQADTQQQGLYLWVVLRCGWHAYEDTNGP